MPEVTPETQVADDLDQRVESLLRQMEDAAHQAAGIAAESEAQAAAIPAPDPAAVPAAPPPVEADLASQVDQLLADAAQAAGDSPAAGEAPKSIGSLDDELARLASDLIEGECRAEDALPPAPGRPPVPAAARVATPAASAPDPTIGDPPIARRHPAAASPAVQQPVAPPKAPLWRQAFAGAKKWARIIAKAVRRHTPTLLALLEPIAFRFAAIVSMPLRNRPALVRDAVGWIALGTTFWASCIFVYFLFIYQPIPPAPTSIAIGLLDPNQPAPEHEAATAARKEEARP